ncbi:MAG: hypothetical protein R2822_09350 [Spirosomataceae bacterium]
MLVIGDIDINYADRVVPVRQPSLVFSNHSSLMCDHLENIRGGKYCIFNQHFFISTAT